MPVLDKHDHGLVLGGDLQHDTRVLDEGADGCLVTSVEKDGAAVFLVPERVINLRVSAVDGATVCGRRLSYSG